MQQAKNGHCCRFKYCQGFNARTLLIIGFSLAVFLLWLLNYSTFVIFGSPKVRFLDFPELDAKKHVAAYALSYPSTDKAWQDATIFNNSVQDFITVGFTNSVNVSQVLPPKLRHVLSILGSQLQLEICRTNANNMEMTALKCDHFTGTAGFRYLAKINGSSVTHIFVKVDTVRLGGESRGILIARLYRIPVDSTSLDGYYFCYGLPATSFSSSLARANCPPCLCPAIFEERSTLSNSDVGLTTLDLARFSFQGHFSADAAKRLEKANALHRNSRFVPCLNMKESSEPFSPEQLLVDGHLGEYTVERIFAVREFYRANGMRLGLHSGTLLGWYRNCSIIKGDFDVDLMLSSLNMNFTFYEYLLNQVHKARKPIIEHIRVNKKDDHLQIKSTRIFGDLGTSVEVRFVVGGVGIDIFIIILDDESKNYPYATTFITGLRKVLYNAFPEDLTFCSTIAFNHLYLVPCDPGSVLAEFYGPNWRTPGSSDYKKGPNIRDTLVLSPKDWAKRKMYVGYEG